MMNNQSMTSFSELPLPALSPGLVAVTGDEGAGKTRLLHRLGSEPSALWLDLSLPGRDDETPEQFWDALRPQCPAWSLPLQQDLARALDLSLHLGKKLFMLSTGSRRKVALVGLLASGVAVTCLDQPYVALDLASVRVIREFLSDVADHETRTWVVADYEADPSLPWRQQLALP
jgi:ABC-type transport system involved in cytochrome c biogenesis ATPase subunit